MKKYFILLILILLTVDLVHSQEQVLVVRRSQLFKEVFNVLANDTSVRNGRYSKYYKDKIIEKGWYRDNAKVGEWMYFSLNSIFEYKYNFDTNKLLAVSGKSSQELSVKTPCLYKGSPLIPYLYIVTNLQYPTKAREKNIQGKIVLALKVNEDGEVYALYLSEKLDPLLDSAVIEVAKTMPIEWRFLPATRDGQKIKSEYRIMIEFELE